MRPVKDGSVTLAQEYRKRATQIREQIKQLGGESPLLKADFEELERMYLALAGRVDVTATACVKVPARPARMPEADGD